MARPDVLGIAKLLKERGLTPGTDEWTIAYAKEYNGKDFRIIKERARNAHNKARWRENLNAGVAAGVNYKLTQQELAVAVQIVEGRSNAQAAGRLEIAEKTVKFHLIQIYKKSRCTHCKELIVKYYQGHLPIVVQNQIDKARGVETHIELPLASGFGG